MNGLRTLLLDPTTSDRTVDQVRDAARGIVEARTHGQLGAAAADLAAAATRIGPDKWPRFLNDCLGQAMSAASANAIPGVIKANAAGTDAAPVAGTLVLGALIYFFSRSHEPLNLPANKPVLAEQASPPDKGTSEPASSGTPAKPGEATLSDDRRAHILDGDKKSGGHASGRGRPEKSKFPPEWTDEKIVEEIESIANDPASTRKPAKGDRTRVVGTRDGIEIEVIIGRDGKAIVTAYPTNAAR